MPRPETAPEATEDAARINGVWQTDSSQHTAARQVTGVHPESLPVKVTPREGRATLHVCYLFSGVSRKASIAQYLSKMCAAEGIGLVVEEIDVHIGGNAHDLLSKEAQ